MCTHIRAPLSVILILSAVACGHHANRTGQSSSATASNQTSRAEAADSRTASAPSNTTGNAQASATDTTTTQADWPDGFVVVSEEEWVPVLGDAGQALHDARAQFQQGNRKQAAQLIRTALTKLDQEQANRSKTDEAQYQRTKASLSALATQLEKGQDVSSKDLDRTLADAYKNDAELDWIYLREDAWVPTFEQPTLHFKRALTLLEQGQNQAAANQIRSGTGYFRVALASAPASDSERLSQQVQALSELATRADQNLLSAGELKRTVATANTVFAECYLQNARNAYAANDPQRAARLLQEGLVRTQAASHWTDSGELAQAESIESVAGKLRAGEQVSANDVRSAFDRLKTQIDQERRAAQAMAK